MTKIALTLPAEARTATGNQLAELRAQGKIPAVVYGHKIASSNVAIKKSDLEKIMRQASASDLIDLQIDNQAPIKVLLHEIDRQPVNDQVLHVDFYQVNMKEKIQTDVALEFVNESPAVKDLSGVLIKTLDHVEIECLPGDLISQLEVDLSQLKQLSDSIRVKDLIVPANVVMLTEPETTVVLVEEQKVEEEKPVEAVPAGEVPTEAEAKAAAEGETKEEKTNEKD